eukprot:7720503-Pyramimonas_sp.AAC.1
MPSIATPPFPGRGGLSGHLSAMSRRWGVDASPSEPIPPCLDTPELARQRWAQCHSATQQL